MSVPPYPPHLPAPPCSLPTDPPPDLWERFKRAVRWARSSREAGVCCTVPEHAPTDWITPDGRRACGTCWPRRQWERDSSTCHACGAQLRWVKTANGNGPHIPVSATTGKNHTDECPDTKRWLRARRSKGTEG